MSFVILFDFFLEPIKKTFFAPFFLFFHSPFFHSLLLKMSNGITVGDTNQASINNISNNATSFHSQVSHSNPNDSLYQAGNKRYTQSAQSYVIDTFTGSSTVTLGASNLTWTFPRTADLGGTPFAIVGLPGVANVVWCSDATGSGAVEIVHPDILDHYRLALGALPGQVVAETNAGAAFYAYDGSAYNNADCNFVHGFEGQPYWTPNVGYHCQTSATECIGNAPIDTQHGLRAAAWAEINNLPGKRMGAMVGGSDLGSIRMNKHLELKRRSMRHQLLFVPLLFTFGLGTESMLPLPAMQFHQIEIKMNLRHASQLICNGSRLPGSGASASNAMGGTSVVLATGTITSDATHCLPFGTSSGLTVGAQDVVTVVRYGQGSSSDMKQKEGDMIALANDATWALTISSASDLSNADCPVNIGARQIFLQGSERAAMIQGGYDIPLVVSQSSQKSFNGGSGSLSQSIDISTFVNSVEALYIVSQSSNALGANHYNAGRTWDPLTEAYTDMFSTLNVKVNGASAFAGSHPAFFNKLMAYLSGSAVPTGDSHVFYAPFAIKSNNNYDGVKVYGSQQAASRWSSATVDVVMPDLAFSAAANGPFSSVSSGKSQKLIAYGDTYNNLHVGQGVGGLVLSNNASPAAGYL